MKRDFSALRNIHIESPCNADWEAMTGDDRARHCEHCEKKVFDLSALPPGEAEALYREHGEGMCVRYRCDERGAMVLPSGRGFFRPFSESRFFLWCVTALAMVLPATSPAQLSPHDGKTAQQGKKMGGKKSPRSGVKTVMLMGHIPGVRLPKRVGPPPHVTMGKPLPHRVLQGAPIAPKPPVPKDPKG